MSTADDFDGCWKHALEIYFPQFMQLLWPDIALRIDWSHRHEFLDQELQKLFGEAQTGVRRVDKLVRVRMLDGTERWLLIHVEIQANLNQAFGRRLMTYHYRLMERYVEVPIYSLVVVTHDKAPVHAGASLFGSPRGKRAGGKEIVASREHESESSRTSQEHKDISASPHTEPAHTSHVLPLRFPTREDANWRYTWAYHPRTPSNWPETNYPIHTLPGTHHLEYDGGTGDGVGLRLRFPVVYLASWRNHKSALIALAQNNPFALVVIAQLEAAATRNGERRLARKTEVVRLMYRFGYHRDDVFRLFQVIDWMIRLPEALEPKFNEVIRQIEAEDNMNYVTSIERVAEKRGTEIGKQLGQAQLLHRQLSRKFGALPDWVETELMQAKDEQLLLWAERVLEVTTLQKVFGR